MAEARDTFDDLITRLPDNSTRQIDPRVLRDIVETVRAAVVASDPTPNDDSANTSGNGDFDVNHYWLNSATPEMFVCLDATPTAAVWESTTASTGGSGGPATQLDANGSILDVNQIDDGEYLKREGTTIVGAAVSGESGGGLIETVAGGSGYTAVIGSVTLDFAEGHVFLLTATGGIDIDVTNMPDGQTKQTVGNVWLKMDATGGHAVTWSASVTPRSGADVANLDTSGNAVNLIQLVQVSSTLYWYVVDTDTVRLPDYTLQFEENETLGVAFNRSETLDLGNVTARAFDGSAADGSLAFEKNGVTASGLTAFIADDVLGIIRSGAAAPALVRIPAYAS